MIIYFRNHLTLRLLVNIPWSHQVFLERVIALVTAGSVRTCPLKADTVTGSLLLQAAQTFLHCSSDPILYVSNT